MSPNEEFATLANRLATIPNILRTRRADAVRAERSVDDFDLRIRRAADKLKKDIAELEKALA